jgi:hypothetical protein
MGYLCGTESEIFIEVSPQYGTMYADGYELATGVQSPFFTCIFVGTHTFTYEVDGYESQSYTVSMNATDTYYHSFILQPTVTTCSPMADCPETNVGGACCVNSCLYTCDSYGNWRADDPCIPCGCGTVEFYGSPTPVTITIYDSNGGYRSGIDYGDGFLQCLPIGYYTVTYEKSGYITRSHAFDVTQTMVDSGSVWGFPTIVLQPYSQNPCPLPTDGWGSVNVSPYGSTLYINGTSFGSWSSGEICLNGGYTYTLRAEYPGYITATKTVAVVANQDFGNVTLVCTENPNPCKSTEGWGSVNVSPYGSTLYVNNISMGSWSSGEICLGGGATYTLRAESPGYLSATKTVTVVANQDFGNVSLVCTTGCTPGEKRCDGAIPQICNTAGTEWVNGTACVLPQVCSAGTCVGGITCNTTNCPPPKQCINNECKTVDCVPACVPPKVCDTTTHACVDPGEVSCDGMERNGTFDPMCIFEKGNEIYLAGSLFVLFLLMSR